MRSVRKNVAVVFGGMSSENEVSVITGTLAVNLLDGAGYAAYPVYLAQDGRMYTGRRLADVSAFRGGMPKADEALFLHGALYAVKGKKLALLSGIDCGLNCCHGAGGEDGLVAALFAQNHIPNASPDMAASALFMDKGLTKLAAKALGVRTAPYFRIGEAEYAKRGAFAIRCVEERIGYPVVVKPACQGSSIGVSVAADRPAFVRAVETAFSFDRCLIAEKYLAGAREINCAAYRAGGEIVLSECEEPVTANEILTFSDKYLAGEKGARRRFPADLPAVSVARVKGYTKLLYRRLGLRGVVRADFLLSGEEVYFNELNTVPGSLACYLFSESLAGFSRVLSDIIGEGIAAAAAGRGKKLLKNTGVFSSFSGKGGKRAR